MLRRTPQLRGHLTARSAGLAVTGRDINDVINDVIMTTAVSAKIEIRLGGKSEKGL